MAALNLKELQIPTNFYPNSQMERHRHFASTLLTAQHVVMEKWEGMIL